MQPRGSLIPVAVSVLCVALLAACDRGIAEQPVEMPPARVDEAGFVSIGGIEQWIGIRGDDARNPAILVIHGGPGESQWPFAARYRPWERHFVVVQWDQRGAGRSYGRAGGKTPDINLERIVQDGIEVTEHLRRRLGKKKIIVLGHSWGTIVAVHMVKARPDMFAAYVGTGQVASWNASVQAQFDLLLAKARRDSDAETVKMLERIGTPDPSDSKQYFTFSRGLRSAMADADRRWLEEMRAAFSSPPPDAKKDFDDFAAGMQLSGESVLPDQMKTDLAATASDIHIPFFVIQGRDDVMTPTAAARAYFAGVHAPVKEMIVIDNAGHFAMLTHREEFLAALVNRVRPLGTSH